MRTEGTVPTISWGSALRMSLVRWSSAILVLLSLHGLAVASRLRPINLEVMTRRADRIVSGRCVDVRAGIDPALGQPVTWVTLVPQRTVKGAINGRLTIKLLGNQTATARPGEATEGVPQFEQGEEVVLFLYGDSPRGLTSPVGFGQGKFKVVRGKNGKSHAVNGFGNEWLMKGLSPGAQRKLGANVERFHGRKSIPPDTLLEMVRVLEGTPADRTAGVDR